MFYTKDIKRNRVAGLCDLIKNADSIKGGNVEEIKSRNEAQLSNLVKTIVIECAIEGCNNRATEIEIERFNGVVCKKCKSGILVTKTSDVIEGVISALDKALTSGAKKTFVIDSLAPFADAELREHVKSKFMERKSFEGFILDDQYKDIEINLVCEAVEFYNKGKLMCTIYTNTYEESNRVDLDFVGQYSDYSIEQRQNSKTYMMGDTGIPIAQYNEWVASNVSDDLLKIAHVYFDVAKELFIEPGEGSKKDSSKLSDSQLKNA